MGISLIGSPEVVLLDEPSASLDPASRQRLWHVIEKHKKSCVMLLTTHSMQEVSCWMLRILLDLVLFEIIDCFFFFFFFVFFFS